MAELKEAGDRYILSGLPTVVKDAALARIRRFICSSVTPAQITALTKWIKVMLDPNKESPTAGDAKTVALINSFFNSQSAWLKDVLNQLTNPCPAP
jgi:hypothetical protein